VLGAQPRLQLVDRRLIRNYIDPVTTVERPETEQIPSNIGHQEGKHRADSGAPPAWVFLAR
jgi:hypothetical protein